MPCVCHIQHFLLPAGDTQSLYPDARSPLEEYGSHKLGFVDFPDLSRHLEWHFCDNTVNMCRLILMFSLICQWSLSSLPIESRHNSNFAELWLFYLSIIISYYKVVVYLSFEKCVPKIVWLSDIFKRKLRGNSLFVIHTLHSLPFHHWKFCCTATLQLCVSGKIFHN